VRARAPSCRTPLTVEQLVSLKHDEDFAAAEDLFQLDPDCRAWQEDHRPRQFLEWPIAVGNAESGDVEKALVLQLATGPGIEERVAKRHIFRTVQAFEQAVEQLHR